MPNAQHPQAKEFFVYVFQARGIPFYVGIGHAKRADYRISFVQRQMEREKSGRTCKWVLHTRVIAKFLKRGDRVLVHYIRKRLRRAEALVLEKKKIKKLVDSGRVLANCHYNPSRPSNAEQVVQYVLRNRN